MLTINIIALGKLKEKWLVDGIAEYSKRLSAYCKFSVIELKEYRISDNPSQTEIDKALEQEARDILSHTAKGAVIAMCIEGQQLSSTQLSDKLMGLSSQHSTINFVIGSSFGLADSIKKQAVMRLSVSPMTFPHQLFRLMLAEQVYRAMSINAGSKYHK